MKNIEKALKKQAESILPSEDIKAKVISRMPSDAEKQETHKARRAPRKYVYSMIAAMLVVCIGLGFGLGFGLGKNDGTPAPIVPSETYVALSINPSFGITANADGIVTEVTALNEDAVIVLYGEDLKGLKIEDAADKIVELSAELGYLSKDGKADFTVCNSDAGTTNKISDAISAKINENATLSALNIKINIDISGITALEQKAKETIEWVDLSGLGADEINKLINGFDENKLREYAEKIDKQYNDVMKKVVDSAQELIEVINDYKPSLTFDYWEYYTRLYDAVQDASECVDIFLNYMGVENTSDIVEALVDIMEDFDGLEKAKDFLLDLCDGDGNFDFDIELLLKAELKTKKTN